MEGYLNKNVIMSEEEEHLFEKSNIYWVCKKFFNNIEEKLRDHCHRKYNANLELTKNVPVIFHNLRSYDSHLIFNELDKFDAKIKVIPNGLEKNMTFF